jgi:hypothetical protein
MDIILIISVPQRLSSSELLVQIAISLWVILLVCAIFSPLIGYWYRTRKQNAIKQIHELKELKKLRREPTTKFRDETENLG